MAREKSYCFSLLSSATSSDKELENGKDEEQTNGTKTMAFFTLWPKELSSSS